MDYPIFALIFCAMKKEEYVNTIVPAVQQFKFNYWGHDSIILHEREIRRKTGQFGFLNSNINFRAKFMSKLSDLIEIIPMKILATVIDKEQIRANFPEPKNPYELALNLCMEQLHSMLVAEKQEYKTVHVVFESRGQKEDSELKLEFQRIIGNNGQFGINRPNFKIFDFQQVFTPKAANSTGLQLADLVARPIGLSQLRPEQVNRATKIIQSKQFSLFLFP